MSATELIKQVADLPPSERALFERLLQEMQDGAHSAVPVHPLQWPDFAERLQGICGHKIAPDSQSIIDEGRGDR